MSLEALFQSGDITYLFIAVMAVEALLFAGCFKRIPGLFAGLAAGACLVLALRSALLDQPWTFVAFFVSLSFVFHVMEIRQWLRHPKPQQQ